MTYKPDADAIVSAFENYWTAPVDPAGHSMPGPGYGLGNIASPRFRQTWLTMAMTYNGALERRSPSFNCGRNLSPSRVQDIRRHWRCLGPATGSGKSEFAFFWLGHLAALGAAQGYQPGAIIICRSIEQCDDAAAKINRWSLEANSMLRPQALAFHSDSPLWTHPERLAPFRVVAITHDGFKAEMRRLVKKQTGKRWNLMQTWRPHGGQVQPRAITIVDEQITSVCDNFDVNLLDLKNVWRFVTSDMKKSQELKVPLSVVETAIGVLEQLAKAHKAKREDDYETAKGGYVYAKRHLAKLEKFDPYATGLDGLADAFRKAYPKPKRDLGKRSADEFGAMLRSIGHLEDVIQLDAYYHQKRGHDVVSAGRYILPHDLNGPCLLDATVNQNSLVALLGEDRASIMPMPERTRSYANVTLHRVRVARTGKDGMLEDASGKVRRLLAFLKSELKAGDKCLVVAHQELEENYIAPALAEAKLDGHVSLAHWFAIDGRNDWSDHNKIVLLGMPYRPRTHFVNLLLALRERDDKEDYLNSSEMYDLRLQIQNKTMVAEVIQAINRVRCRRTIDEDGNCLPVSVFTLLPNDSTGDAIEQAITREMPRLELSEWDFKLTDKAVGGKRTTDPRDREFVVAVKRAAKLGGEWELSSLLEDANLDSFREYQAELAKKASNPKSFIARELLRLGAWLSSSGRSETLVRYVCFAA